MKKSLYLLTILGLLVGIFGLSSCGKAALPDKYEDSGYPHNYPQY